MSIQLTGSCLPLGCSAAAVKTGNPGPAASTALTGPSVLEDAVNPSTPPLASLLCLPPSLLWAALAHPGGCWQAVGPSMGTRRKWSPLPHHEAARGDWKALSFHPLAAPSWCCSTCEATIFESLMGLGFLLSHWSSWPLASTPSQSPYGFSLEQGSQDTCHRHPYLPYTCEKPRLSSRVIEAPKREPLPCVSCMTLDKLLSSSVPQFLWSSVKQ